MIRAGPSMAVAGKIKPGAAWTTQTQKIAGNEFSMAVAVNIKTDAMVREMVPAAARTTQTQTSDWFFNGCSL